MALIKHLPEDFVVTELQDKSFAQEGKYAYFWMTKTSMTTLRAVESIASELKIPLKRIAVAGNKDKRAVTRQLISIADIHEADARRAYLPNMVLSFLGYRDAPLHLGDLDGNHFDITVRDITEPSTVKNTHLFPNLYGAQRFSTNNAEIGEHILRQSFSEAVELVLASGSDYAGIMKDYLDENPKNKVGALKLLPKNLLKMYVHSFQSLLWNEILMFFLDGKDSKAFDSLTDVTLPIPGFNVSCDEATGRLLQKVLAHHKIEERDFILRSFPEISLEGDNRRAFATIRNFAVTVEDDELFNGKKKAILSFDLGKGSYATVAVRYIIGEPVEEYTQSMSAFSE